ncbi:PAS/PAC sensor protein [Natrialba chahannaoensis JCM 10990]|uniref:PAS/PAC sensor protein n=1 Tax=Natrialba chahannaoensis JCM 10990 TaxID=1227492 RepID=M0AGG4_9EURY|nr:bacterio-opsin activator domain-containing protein [Natrialba chahannaoensis]ELY96972.1 PAS/PAC sensor protein [Natrialba chahannaoensis JCM 10990]
MEQLEQHYALICVTGTADRRHRLSVALSERGVDGASDTDSTDATPVSDIDATTKTTATSHIESDHLTIIERTLADLERTDGGTGNGLPDDVHAVVIDVDEPSALETTLDWVDGHQTIEPSSCVVAPKDGSEALAATALRQDVDQYVPSDEDVLDCVLETVAEPTASTPDDEYHRIIANELPDEAFIIDEDGVYLETKVRPTSADLYTASAENLVGSSLDDVFPEETASSLQECVTNTIESGDVQTLEYRAETTDGERFFEARVVPINGRINGKRAVVWLARDITERAEREAELRARQAHLETLNRINAVIRQVIETLVDAPTRDAIEQEVCAELVDSGLYCGCWIAERTGAGEFRYRTGAGEATTYLEKIRQLEDDAGTLSSAVVYKGASGDVDPDSDVKGMTGSDTDIDADSVDRPLRPTEHTGVTGEITSANHILKTEPLPEPLQEAAHADDVRAAITVPIVHEQTTYGVLTVLASRAEAFSDTEQEEFKLLGETMGFSIMAVKNRQLLFADTVVELEFRINGGETFSFDLSSTYDCTCILEWAGTTGDGQPIQYVRIEGLDGDTVLDEAEAHESVESCRLIHDGHDHCTIEIRLTKSGVRTLANHGATIRDVRVEDGVGTCVVEVPQHGDVRDVAEALSVVYENTELTARREVDRPVHTAVERRNRILGELTDRQLTTLRLAYFGGFFEWPRSSTGEDIAEALGVTPPTMHQHLRKALKTVLSEFFADGNAVADADKTGGIDGGGGTNTQNRTDS